MAKRNGRKCVHCGKSLTGRQRLYCSNSHKTVYLRKQQEQVKQEREAQTNSTVDLSLYEQVQSELDTAKGVIVATERERDTIRTERDQALQNVSELQRENGALQAKIEMLERQNKEPSKQSRSWRDRLFRR